MSYRYVEYFSLHKEDGPRFKVHLREWVPDWVQAGESTLAAVHAVWSVSVQPRVAACCEVRLPGRDALCCL